MILNANAALIAMMTTALTSRGHIAGGRKAILVLGMHRSGTSALTRTLGLCGAALPKRQTHASFGNEDVNYWESRAINALHEELVFSIGSSMNDRSDVPSAWYETLGSAYYRRRIISALDRDFGAAPLIVVKDPRLCRLVPLWLSAFDAIGIEPCVVLPVRNPIEVATSLQVRDGTLFTKALQLWLRHFVAAERDTRTVRRTIVAYTDLLKDWRGLVDKVGADLDIRWPDRSPEAASEIDRFLRTELRHHTFNAADVQRDPRVSENVKIAYDWALRAIEGKPVDPAVLDAIDGTLAPAGRPSPYGQRPVDGHTVADRTRQTAVAREIWGLVHSLKVTLWHGRRTLKYLRRSGLRATAVRVVRELR